MKKNRPAEGELEQWAREIVAFELGVEVTRNDDGTADGQPDALIHLPRGPVPLEVVADHDVPYLKLQDAGRKRGKRIPTPFGQTGWFVSLRHSSDRRLVDERLPKLLKDVPTEWFATGSAPFDDVLLFDDPEYTHLSYLLDKIGVVYLSAWPAEPGVIRLSEEGWYSWDDPIELVPWISRVLQRERDVPTKLARHGGAQLHAFIWATPGSSWYVNSTLRHDDDDEPVTPDLPPDLPPGVTHVWVASVMSRRHVLYWGAEEGWKRGVGLSCR